MSDFQENYLGHVHCAILFYAGFALHHNMEYIANAHWRMEKGVPVLPVHWVR